MVEPIKIPIAGKNRDSNWYLSTHSTPNRSYTIEIVLNKTGEQLVIYDPESALEYIQNHLQEVEEGNL